MQFHELEAFIALADTLNFARAAEIVHVSPSAFSRMVQRVEEELGVQLVIRDTRRTMLTEAGDAFLDFARDSIHRRDDLRLRLGKNDDKLHGILRMYASVTACYSILPRFVKALSVEQPDLRLSVESGDPAEATPAVQEGRAEIAVDAIPDTDLQGLKYYSITKSPLVFVAEKTGKYAAALQDCYKPEILFSSVPLILPKIGLARERYDKWVRLMNIKPQIAAETEGNEAAFALARLDLGVGLVPRIILENSPFADGLVIYDAGSFLGHYDIGFVMKPDTRKQFLYDTLTTLIERTYK
ncbi:MAG: hypothetical protein BKP49_04530 [Treponema sp. CETP13]|nr:MAG: hypothetical protein BKP49_04530 [Treponema sp. CETP13]